MADKTYFDQLLSKEGETISRYAHSYESSRDATTNLKESKWAASVNITAIVRSQVSSSREVEAGRHTVETILVLTSTAIADHDVLKWNNKYFDVILVEEVFARGTRQYYKGTAQRRVEFLGA